MDPTIREVETAIRMARAYAAEQLPWFSTPLYAARLVVTETCPALAAIDRGMRVYFNPRMVAQLLGGKPTRDTIAQLGFVWIHEISHALREHGSRAEERQAAAIRWNMAADMEINDSDWEGLSAPSAFPPVLPEQYDLPRGQLAESYYNALEHVVSFLEIVGDEGSGVHGKTRPWEIGEQDEKSPAVSDFDQMTLRQEVAEAIDKGRGSIPAGWERWAATALRPRVNWRERLRRRIRGAIVTSVGGRVDYSFQRPHRRADVYAPIIRPSLSGNVQVRVACVVDTSGSMSSLDLGRALAEVRGVLESLRCPVTVIPCDARAYEPVAIHNHSGLFQLHKGLTGGGGTNMVAGIDAALRLQPAPDAVVVLTDGFTPYPNHRYDTTVLFGILKHPNYKPVRPPMPPWRAEDVVVIEANASSA